MGNAETSHSNDDTPLSYAESSNSFETARTHLSSEDAADEPQADAELDDDMEAIAGNQRLPGQ